MDKKEIAVFHPTLNPAGGGEVVSLHLIKTLTNQGYNVTLVTIEKTNWSKLEQVFGNVTLPMYEHYTVRKIPELHSPLVENISLIIAYIVKLLWYKYKKKEFDLLINTCGEKINSVSDIVYFNAIPLRCAYKISSTNLFRKLTSRLYNLMLTPLDGINSGNTLIANSEFNKKLISNTIKRDSVVVYPPINLDNIKPKSVRKNDSVVIVTRFLPEQNLELIPELVTKTLDVQYTLIGTASKQSEPTLKKLYSSIKEYGIDDRVRIYFNGSFSFYTSKLEEAKIMLRLLPSEPFGISILEAMHLGCVPIVHRSSGPWEDILEKKQGFYGFSFSSIEELSEIIMQLLADQGLQDVIQKRVKKRASEFQGNYFSNEMTEIISKSF